MYIDNDTPEGRTHRDGESSAKKRERLFSFVTHASTPLPFFRKQEEGASGASASVLEAKTSSDAPKSFFPKCHSHCVLIYRFNTRQCR